MTVENKIKADLVKIFYKYRMHLGFHKRQIATLNEYNAQLFMMMDSFQDKYSPDSAFSLTMSDYILHSPEDFN